MLTEAQVIEELRAGGGKAIVSNRRQVLAQSIKDARRVGRDLIKDVRRQLLRELLMLLPNGKYDNFRLETSWLEMAADVADVPSHEQSPDYHHTNVVLHLRLERIHQCLST